jgi:3-isopropylmalate dehydrogenase
MGDTFKVLVLPGDGIGPEVVAAGVAILDAVAEAAGIALACEEDLLHGAAWDAWGTFCRDETVAAALAADAVLVGAVGGPKWDGITVPGGAEMQDGLMRLRLALQAYAGLRPARALACLEHLSPYRPELVAGADILVLREMCGGAFFGAPRGVDRPTGGLRRGYDTAIYDEGEITRIAHAGFLLARRRRGKLTSIDKANVMQSCALWREVMGEIGGLYPDVALEHMYADAASYRLACAPAEFDVIVGDNLFGDIISDQTGAVAGSLGMLPSACLTGPPEAGRRVRGLYEPVHGSAPDIAGEGIANPVGTILSVAMMLEYSFARPDLAHRIERAVEHAVADGARTPDIGGTATTSDVTKAVLAALSKAS